MNMKLKNRLKKILTEALVACLLLAPAVLPPAGPGEVGMPGEVLTGSEQPGADDEVVQNKSSAISIQSCMVN